MVATHILLLALAQKAVFLLLAKLVLVEKSMPLN